MVSTLIPAYDLVPQLPSRVVNLDVVDGIEDAPSDGEVTFTLTCDIHVPSRNGFEGRVVKKTSYTVTLSGGEGAIRLPCYVDWTKPNNWAIEVKKSWAPYLYTIRVPEGDGPINFADLMPLSEATSKERQFLPTSWALALTEGSAWAGSLSESGGVVTLRLTTPPGAVAWAKGEIALGSNLDSLAEGEYRVSSASAAATLTSSSGGLPVVAAGIIESLGVAQNRVQRWSVSDGSVWQRECVEGTWSGWHRTDSQSLPITMGTTTVATEGDPTVTMREENGERLLDFTLVRGPEGPYGGTEVTDPQVASYVTSPTATETQAALDARYVTGDGFRDRVESVTGDERTLYVSPTGSDENSGLSMAQGLATIPAALAKLGTDPGTIILGHGTIYVDGTIKWPRAPISLKGQGSLATTLKARNQTGPILDMSDVVYKMNGREISGFALHGDGTPGAEKEGLRLSSYPIPSFLRLDDIITRYTGGSGLNLGALELAPVSRITVYEPINSAAADIPYIQCNGAFNGNVVDLVTLYGESVSPTPSAPKSGVFRILPDEKWAPHGNILRGIMGENIRMQSDSTIIHITGGDNVIDSYMSYDAHKVAGSTGSSHIRLATGEAMGTGGIALDAGAALTGGNLILGIIPGGSVGPDMGVDMRQSYNSVLGVKGYNGNNVVISSGVGNCSIVLNGSMGQATTPAVVDNSGTGTNKVTDSINNVGTAWAGYSMVAKGAYYGPDVAASGTTATTASRLYAVPLQLPTASRFTEIAAEVTTAASGATLRMGIYKPNPLDRERPQLLLKELGTADAGTTGVKTVACDVTLPAGLYWLAIAVQGGAPGLRSLGAGSLPVVNQTAFGTASNAYFSGTATPGALPSAFGGCVPIGNGPKVMVKAG